MTGRFEIKQAAIYDEHAVSVWRVCWNVTGTILATSGDDGQVVRTEIHGGRGHWTVN